MSNRIQHAIGTRFRRIITGDPSGVPPWLSDISSGSDYGIFLPSDAPWLVHADLSTLIGGIRALLMQALHPGSLAGVAAHSRYETDPLGRLAGTTKWLTILTFGGKQAIARESDRVNQMHDRVRGKYQSATGDEVSYQAKDSDLLQWVHVAFTDSFLRTFQLYSPNRQLPIADEYVSKWAKAVTYLGLPSGPQSEQELVATLNSYLETNQLAVTDQTKRVLTFIKRPPLSKVALIVYGVLFQAALVSIPEPYKSMLGMKSWPKGIIIPLARTLMRLMKLAIGPHSPLEEAALARLKEIGAITV